LGGAWPSESASEAPSSSLLFAFPDISGIFFSASDGMKFYRKRKFIENENTNRMREKDKKKIET